MATKVILINTS